MSTSIKLCKPKYPVIATDLDGTLLQNGNRIVPEQLFPMIEAYLDRGGIFLPASGRQYRNLQQLFAPVRDRIAYICENGCLVFYRDRLIHRAVMDREEGIALIEQLRTLPDVEILVSGIHTCYVEPGDMSFYRYMTEHVKNRTQLISDLRNTPEEFFKISGFSPNGTESFSAAVEEMFSDRLNVVTGGGNWLDIMPKEVSKASALQALAENLELDLSEAVALGDQRNDLELLHLVGHPACVGNAVPEVKAVCEREMESGADLLAYYLNA